MQQILDYGYWSDYSCAARPWAMSSWAIAGVICLSAISTYRIATSLPRHQMKLAILSCGAISLFCMPLIVIIPALARTTTMIFVEENDIVRTGCWRGRPYEERSPLSEVRSRYYEANNRSKVSELFLQWPQQKGSVRIDLINNQNLAVLATIAPKAMSDYVKDLQAEGREVPAPLRTFAK